MSSNNKDNYDGYKTMGNYSEGKPYSQIKKGGCDLCKNSNLTKAKQSYHKTEYYYSLKNDIVGSLGCINSAVSQMKKT